MVSGQSGGELRDGAFGVRRGLARSQRTEEGETRELANAKEGHVGLCLFVCFCLKIGFFY